MRRVPAVLHRLVHPPRWVLLALPPIVDTILVCVLLGGQKHGAPAYMIYGMSAYCLLIRVVPLPRLLRRAGACLVRWLRSTALGSSYMDSPAFRGSVSLYAGMTADFLYVVFRVLTGIRYASVWFVMMAAYHLLLGLIRLSLVLSCRNRNAAAQLRSYRTTAWLLLLLSIPLGGMIALMVITDTGCTYPGYVIYLSCLYTFYTIILSVVNLVRFRRVGSPILSASKVLSFVAALMSLLGLQTAMISQFSTDAESMRRTMNALTGGCVWLAVLLICGYMLLHSRNVKEVEPVEPLGKQIFRHRRPNG